MVSRTTLDCTLGGGENDDRAYSRAERALQNAIQAGLVRSVDQFIGTAIEALLNPHLYRWGLNARRTVRLRYFRRRNITNAANPKPASAKLEGSGART